MKASIIIYLCVVLLPSIISGTHDDGCISSNNNPYGMSNLDGRQEQLNQARTRLDEMVINGGNISKIFKPFKFLGKGVSCIIYEGELLQNHKIVAMKFAPSARDNLRLEFEMYSYLNAIDNPTVESYGIPAVYYYGEWEGYQMIAITLLDSKFQELRSTDAINWSNIDIFIICREFVRISKYMHGRGVYHGGIHIWNIMFRGNKGFIIDFNRASKVSDWHNMDCRKAEWGNFLYNVCNLCGLDDRRIDELPNGGLKKVLLRFAYNIYKADRVNYDRMHHIITREIRKQGVQEPASVSWLTDAQKCEALAGKNPTPDIRSIANPYPTTPFVYSRPNYNHFVNQSE